MQTPKKQASGLQRVSWFRSADSMAAPSHRIAGHFVAAQASKRPTDHQLQGSDSLQPQPLVELESPLFEAAREALTNRMLFLHAATNVILLSLLHRSRRVTVQLHLQFATKQSPSAQDFIGSIGKTSEIFHHASTPTVYNLWMKC